VVGIDYTLDAVKVIVYTGMTYWSIANTIITRITETPSTISRLDVVLVYGHWAA
jgi:hypothetical protein